ncbi:gephyrin-like molybdotransferase Glp [Aestuariimicrobium kwangyangense]|uniref:molybdopterin molybdotransferase MoeA n=1 Tax=Aestuariimicrobium kwangyangense TaxID=396389 RepID=UPI0004153336|nr:gephyrin-like molybdotransferase Glp [Aestuariimicrobium kwangyangense]
MPLFGRKKKEPIVEVEPPKPTLPQGPQVDQHGLRAFVAHRDYLLSLVEPLPPFGMQLLDALGLALCEEITAHSDLPRAALATEAGYAVRADDVAAASNDEPITLAVADAAGELSQGAAVRVDAHTALPDGADAVLPLPFTDRGDREVKVFESVRAGEYVRQRGEDVTDGDVLAREGQVLDERTAGLLAALGFDKVLARPRPRVVVVSVGDSLVEPGRRLSHPTQVHDANGFMIAAAAKRAGCQVWRVGVVSNDPEVIRETISDQLIRADLIISTGGVADGSDDLVRAVMPELGLTDFAELALRPGRQQGFGLIGDDKVPMLMLPARPLSAFVSFELFARPIVRTLMGADPAVQPMVRAITPTVLRSPAGVTTVVPAVVRDETGVHRVEVFAGGDSQNLSDLARANALVVIGADTEVVTAGSSVRCVLLGD